MKQFVPVLFLFLIGCDGILAPQQDDDDDPRPKNETIACNCDKYNKTTDWVYCEPFTVNFDLRPAITRAEMNYSLRNSRGSSVIIAELFDVKTGYSIPFSQVESVVDYVTHTRFSEDIAGYLDGERELVVRFRNTEEGAVSYIPNTSKLVLFFR